MSQLAFFISGYFEPLPKYFWAMAQRLSPFTTLWDLGVAGGLVGLVVFGVFVVGVSVLGNSLMYIDLCSFKFRVYSTSLEPATSP